ncbi:DUF6973 domain-containing protein [Mycolicibacterium fortuitum]|uniref:Uncharacterized protein n=2 Tax=Mycolicibacterium fortuitum TaxID=1766 RepID=A0A0N9XFJ9_MYCFO|nr:EspA/EspE family type VII secretion system effector [Mycolicibacterium fortuitum]AIY45060.1 hypothetical protein G155_05155 [Mycobacterium sp. VKM Ac-1817D]MDO3239551.1 EspA/EspE family type VII secretion system effector [Mycobacteroides abscessus subsp. abscessus]CRL80237.1 hypothetical protein CPGR_03435 [Mycolicibacter nonchromogenicus]ALI24854.1 hypothetical protein XA26_09950 [Mycolicibacterium fortuitum]AMD54010.1 hypothetical protein ATO49_04740 [Mycolicibacterium fortuitum subsp. fo
MSAIDAFYSTWSRARETFGSGVPQDGSQLGDGSRLRQMQSTIESAKPDDRWQGAASQAYAAKNAEHAAVYGKLADLDQRMAAEVTRAADVVTAGRQNLAQTHSWVQSMEASIPPGKTGDIVRVILAGKGIGRISDVITQSTSDMSDIGQRIEDIRREYEAIAGEKAGVGTSDLPEGDPPPVDPLDELKRKYQVDEDPDGKLDWEPAWPFSELTDPKQVTATEGRMLDRLSLFELRDLDQLTEAAKSEAISRFPPPHHPDDTADNHTDAFRHAYWNALMTQRFGEDWTRDFTTAHERLPNNPSTAEAMDLYNNEVGRNIAKAHPDATPAELADYVEQAVRQGDTVVVAPNSDGEKLAWSNTVPEGGAGITSKSTIPGQAPTPTGAGPGGVYDPGQPGGYGTSAGGY